MTTNNGSDTEYLLIANGSAGSTDDASVGAAISALAEHARVRLRWTSDPDEVAAVVRDSSGATPVLLGGDGTISSSVDALVESDLGHVPVGMVAAGTGNDFARAAGIPLDPAAAARGIVSGSPRQLSVLAVSGEAGDRKRFGVNALHVGIGAAASRAASDWKSGLGPVAYPLAAALTGLRSEAARMHLETAGSAEGDLESVTVAGAVAGAEGAPVTTMVVVMLGSSIGGGVEVAEDDSLLGSTAEVLRASGDSVGDRLRLAARLVAQGVEPAGVDTTRAARVRISCDRPVPVNLDGEDLGDLDRLEVEVVPRAWTLIDPSEDL